MSLRFPVVRPTTPQHLQLVGHEIKITQLHIIFVRGRSTNETIDRDKRSTGKYNYRSQRGRSTNETIDRDNAPQENTTIARNDAIRKQAVVNTNKRPFVQEHIWMDASHDILLRTHLIKSHCIWQTALRSVLHMNPSRSFRC